VLEAFGIIGNSGQQQLKFDDDPEDDEQDPTDDEQNPTDSQEDSDDD
jgi:hypothetical protein